VLGFLTCQFNAKIAQADVAADEAKIRQQLGHATSLECDVMPLSDVLDFLGDYHDITIEFDRPEIKRINVDISPRTHVTKKTDGRLDDTLCEILEPNNLSYMIKDGKLLVTSQPKARPWQEKYMSETGRSK
jgi:hypothetical protein